MHSPRGHDGGVQGVDWINRLPVSFLLRRRRYLELSEHRSFCRQ